MSVSLHLEVPNFTMDPGSFPTTAEGFRIEMCIGGRRLPEIIRFLRAHFHPEESMMKSIRENVAIDEEEASLMEEDEDNIVIKAIRSSPCLIAVHEDSGEIAGINLMILSTRPKENEPHPVFDFDSFKSKIAKNCMQRMNEIIDKADLFNRYPETEAVLEFFAIAVEEESRRKGLAVDLTNAGIELARRMPEVEVVFALCTSSYSKDAVKEAGLESVLDFDVLEFKDAGGEPEFRVKEPHNVASVMALKL